MKIAVRPLTPDDWPVFAELFGTNGACGGCWCMHFRLPRGGKLWEEHKGAKNRRAMKRFIERGEQRGCLAFAGNEVVGWASVGPRADYERMDNSRVYRTPLDEGAWSVPCFFVKRGWQGRGVGLALLKAAVALARSHGAPHLLGYPVVPKQDKPIPGPFAFTGLPSMFERAGFTDATPEGAQRPVWMKRFRRKKA